MVMFAYGGIEIIGITAGEAKILRNRFRVRLTPCRCVFWCLCWYAVRHYVYLPVESGWHCGSPFVLTFQHMGITFAASILTLLC